jgi:predicted ATPase
MGRKAAQQTGSPVVELAGLPGAGKTTTAALLACSGGNQHHTFEIISEVAERCPLDAHKGSWQFTAWVICETMVEALARGYRPSGSVYLFDRGVVDALCWLRWLRQTRRIAEEYAQTLGKLLRMVLLERPPSAVFVLDVSFSTSLARKGSEGRIVNRTTFQQLKRAYATELEELLREGVISQIHQLSTDEFSRFEVAQFCERHIEHLYPKQTNRITAKSLPEAASSENRKSEAA